jgi:hypothetical protein
VPQRANLSFVGERPVQAWVGLVVSAGQQQYQGEIGRASQQRQDSKGRGCKIKMSQPSALAIGGDRVSGTAVRDQNGIAS